MDQAVNDYINGLAPDCQPLFERIHRLILDECPEAGVGLSYKLPTYTVGARRLHLGAWKHGVSIYGWKHADDGFTARHPELQTSTGTIRLRAEDAAAISDEEIRGLARAALMT
ncbi:MAG: iron chaperone [Nocardioidaceae bacterium]